MRQRTLRSGAQIGLREPDERREPREASQGAVSKALAEENETAVGAERLGDCPLLFCRE